MSLTGMPSVMQITRSIPAAAASMIASAANGGGTKIIAGVGARSDARQLVDRVEDRESRRLRLATLARRHTADHLGAVVAATLRVEQAFFAGDALNDQASVFVQREQPWLQAPLAAANRPSRPRIGHLVGDDEIERCVLVQHADAPLRRWCPRGARPPARCTVSPSSSHRRHDAARDAVRAGDAAEDVDQHRLDVGVRKDDAEGVLHRLLRSRNHRRRGSSAALFAVEVE